MSCLPLEQREIGEISQSVAQNRLTQIASRIGFGLTMVSLGPSEGAEVPVTWLVVS